MLFTTCVNTGHTRAYEALFCVSLYVHKGSINASHDCVRWLTNAVPTCGQKAMSSKQQLWRHLHFGFALVLKSRKVSLVLIRCHLYPGPIVRWNGTDQFIKAVLSQMALKWMKKIPQFKLTVTVRLVQDLRLDDLLDHVLQRHQTHDLVERISLPFVVHFLDNGQVRFSCEEERQSNWDFRDIGPLRSLLERSFHPTAVAQGAHFKRII